MPGQVCKEIKDGGIALSALTECIKSGVESEESSPTLVEIDPSAAEELIAFYRRARERLEDIASRLFHYPSG